MGLFDGHAISRVDSDPPSTERPTVLRAGRTSREVIELDVGIDGRFRQTALGRVGRKWFPYTVDIEDESGPSYGGDDEGRVARGLA